MDATTTDAAAPVLRFRINALAEAERISGENLLAHLANLEEGTTPPATTARLLFWAGRLSASPTLTLDEAGAEVDEIGAAAALALIAEAVRADLMKGSKA